MSFTTLPRKPRMSTAQTYLVAHLARSKLTREAARSDHNLRLLVGHANMLDNLMESLASSERDQEAWFNSTVSQQPTPAPEHIRWAETIAEAGEDDYDSESDSDNDEVPIIPQRRVPVVLAHPLFTEAESDSDSDGDEEEDDDDDEDLASLQLVRTHSNILSSSPPALVHDDHSDSEDDGPVSPLQQLFEEFTTKDSKPKSAQPVYFQEGLFFARAF